MCTRDQLLYWVKYVWGRQIVGMGSCMAFPVSWQVCFTNRAKLNSDERFVEIRDGCAGLFPNPTLCKCHKKEGLEEVG